MDDAVDLGEPEEFPSELWVHVFTHLTARDFLSITSVCTTWRNLILDPKFLVTTDMEAELQLVYLPNPAGVIPRIGDACRYTRPAIHIVFFCFEHEVRTLFRNNFGKFSYRNESNDTYYITIWRGMTHYLLVFHMFYTHGVGSAEMLNHPDRLHLFSFCQEAELLKNPMFNRRIYDMPETDRDSKVALLNWSTTQEQGISLGTFKHDLPARCSFSRTGRMFQPQPFYSCYTCWPGADEFGCCVTCGPICHAGHDLKYKFSGGFFCDCGAGDGVRPCLCLGNQLFLQDGLKPIVADTLKEEFRVACDKHLAFEDHQTFNSKTRGDEPPNSILFDFLSMKYDHLYQHVEPDSMRRLFDYIVTLYD